MQYSQFEIRDQVGIITLARPEVLNSFNIPMGQEVRASLEKCKNDDSVRAIYLTGEGRGFCAGQELQEAIDENGPGIVKIVEETYNPIVRALSEIEKPVICMVNGVAAGAGANIALACDITFAIETAKFVQAFSSIGLIPDSGGTFTLPRLIGRQRAAALMYTADKVTAKEAEEMGMIYKCLKEEEKGQAMDMAVRLAKRPTKGIGLTKRALNASETNDLKTQLDLEKQLQKDAFDSMDCKEGVNAFLEKRKPQFTGK